MADHVSQMDCIKCGVQLKPFTHVCPNCHGQQFEARSCSWCFRPIPMNYYENCPNCPHCNRVKFRPPSTSTRPCVLCETWLEVHTEETKQCYRCLTCLAPQDFVDLEALTFKLCCNRKCNQELVISCEKCWKCNTLQSNSVPPQTVHFNEVKWSNPYLVEHLKQHCRVKQGPSQLPQIQQVEPAIVFPEATSEVKGGGAFSINNDQQLRFHEINDNRDDSDGDCDNFQISSNHGSPNLKHDTLQESLHNDCKKDSALLNQVPVELLANNSTGSVLNEKIEVGNSSFSSQLIDHGDTEVSSIFPSFSNKELPVKNSQIRDATNSKLNSVENNSKRDEDDAISMSVPDPGQSLTNGQHDDHHTEEVVPLASGGSKLVSPNRYVTLQSMSILIYTCKDSYKNQAVLNFIFNFDRIQLPGPGFCEAENQDQMCIVFQAVVRKEDWGWDDESSQVYMRFEGELYGNFASEYGPGEIERYIVVTVTCKIAQNCMVI